MRQKQFDAAGMLDFQVDVALGDQTLTPAEWQQLMAEEDGLVLLRGQWVEVDREKLKEALDHWKLVQRQAADGLSFFEGMRLLAGVPADLVDDGQDRSEERPGHSSRPASGSARSSPRCATPSVCRR